MSRNYLGVSEAWTAEHIALARNILAGNIKFTPEGQAFYTAWARRCLAFHGVLVEAPPVAEEAPKQEQGRLF